MTATNYAWNPVFDCVTKESDETGAVIAEYTHEPKLYGGLISQHRSGVTNFYHYDALGTTRALTSSSQATTDTSVYSAFGEKVASIGATVNPFGFKGQIGFYRIVALNILCAREQFLSFLLARWYSQHRSNGIIALPLSVYTYAFNRPLRPFNHFALLTASFANAAPPTTEGDDLKPVTKVGNFTFNGCSEDEVKRLTKAYGDVCTTLFPKCSDGTGLKGCFDDLCSKMGGRTWEINCIDGGSTRDDKMCSGETTCAESYTKPESCAPGSKCKPYRILDREISFCRMVDLYGKDKTKKVIPGTGCESIEAIFIHEMLHYCCLDHHPEDPKHWEEKIYKACEKKCAGADYLEVDPKDCKCRPDAKSGAKCD